MILWDRGLKTIAFILSLQIRCYDHSYIKLGMCTHLIFFLYVFIFVHILSYKYVCSLYFSIYYIYIFVFDIFLYFILFLYLYFLFFYILLYLYICNFYFLHNLYLNYLTDHYEFCNIAAQRRMNSVVYIYVNLVVCQTNKFRYLIFQIKRLVEEMILILLVKYRNII